MKLLVIGAGSIGAYFGGRAAQGGAEVEVVAHSGFEKISQEGFIVSSIAGDFVFHPSRVLHSPAEASGDIDIVILATKVLPDIDRVKLLADAAALPGKPAIMLMQNGVGIEDEIAAAFPGNELFSTIAYIGASRSAVNRIDHQGAGRLITGKWGGGDSTKLHELSGIFQKAGVSCEISGNIELERWRKLLWNLPFNPVSVLGGGLDSGELCDRGSIENLCSTLMDEVIAVANASGVALTREMADEQIAYTRDFPPYKTSMLQDYEAGRALEVDALLGNVLKIAGNCSVPVPAIAVCAALLNSVDRKNRQK